MAQNGVPNGATASNANIEDGEKHTVHYCDTQTEVKKISYIWRIHNFSFYRGWDIGQIFTSSTFSSGSKVKDQWCIDLKPMGETREGKEYVSLYLRLVSCNVSTVNLNAKVFILDAKKKKISTFSLVKIFHKGDSLGWGKLIKRDFLLEATNGILSDDTLTIVCEAEIFTNMVNIPGILKIPNEIKVPPCRLSKDYDLVFEKNDLSDVSIIVDGKTEFRMHKVILAARSPVFAAMFNHTMEEQECNRVQIKNMDPDVLREMLRFIYTGRVMNIERIAAELIVAADRYDLQRLKVMCEAALCQSLEIVNAAHILMLADFHNAEQLKAQAKSFISRWVKDVLNTEGYKAMVKSHPQFVDAILHSLVNSNAEKSATT